MFGKGKRDKHDDDKGQLSEVTAMTPNAGQDSIPGTAQEIPEAADTGHQVHEGPKDYAHIEDTTGSE